jgi:hypothetical protein
LRRSTLRVMGSIITRGARKNKSGSYKLPLFRLLRLDSN